MFYNGKFTSVHFSKPFNHLINCIYWLFTDYDECLPRFPPISTLLHEKAYARATIPCVRITY